jgi:alpha-mannosidase
MSLPRCWILAVACLGAGSSALADEPATKPTFWIIPHTHWEGAVFKTREGYLESGLANIVKAMRLLREQPAYRFTLDQVAYVKPFLDRYPEQEADFRRFLAEGRLQLVGALNVMPDVNLPGGETFVRQMQYGKGYYRRKLGVDVTSAWLVDTFGHHAQLPQLLAQGGFKTFWFVRGVPRLEQPPLFSWEGIDGTRMPSFYLPYSYAVLWPTPREADKFRDAATAWFNRLSTYPPGDRVGVSGADVSEPEEHQVAMVEAFNKDPKAPFTIRLGVPADFEAAVSKGGERPVFRGELNPIFQGVYSSRIDIKQRMREAERLLLNAEKLGAVSAWLGDGPELENLWRAWEPVLFNETHDLASGVMTDHVYADTLRNYDFSAQLAEEMTDARWTTLANAIDTQGPGAPVVVFNSLGWSRADLAQIDLGFDEGGVTGVSLVDDQGQSVPSQILESTRYHDNGLKTAKLAFIAHDVPSLGYKVYHATPVREPILQVAAPANDVLENKLYRVAVDSAKGAITSLRVKADDWEVFSGRANVVARQDDKGDLWEPYHGLDGGSRVAMTTRESIPTVGAGPNHASFTDQLPGKPGTIVSGPVLSELRMKNSFDSGHFATMIRVYEGLRRIDVETRLVNSEKYVRYRALFPTTIQNGKTVHEIPFGSIERPDAIEFPAQNWADVSDGKHGLALLNIGVPGNTTTGGAMMLSLLRAHNLGAYGFGGGYEPGMSSETGFQIGQERVLRYSLLPHAGDPREAGVYRDALELNHPLICRKVLPHAGVLPKRWGFLNVSAPNVVVSSVKPTAAGHCAVRVYEASGKATANVAVRPQPELLVATEANLLEDAGQVLKIENNAVRFDLRPFEIKTILLRLKPAKESRGR